MQKKGVAVITLDGDLDRERFRDARKFYVGTDNLTAGEQAGICAKNLRPDGGDFVDFVGRTGAQNAKERMDGFAQSAGEKFHERDRMPDDLDRTKARDNVRNALRNFPDLKMLVGIWSYNAPAIVDVVKEVGNRQQVTIVAFDAEKLAIEQMGDGMIDAMVVQNPFEIGYQTARLLKAMVHKTSGTLKEMFPQAGRPGGRSVRHRFEDRRARRRFAAEGRDVFRKDRILRSAQVPPVAHRPSSGELMTGESAKLGRRSWAATESGLALATVLVLALTALVDTNHNYWYDPGPAPSKSCGKRPCWASSPWEPRW